MLKREVLNWGVGVVAVAVAIWLARAIGLTLKWPNALNVIVFIPVLALANLTVRPILRLSCIPINCLTFGLFGFVINALVFWLAGAVTGAKMTFLSALFGSVVVSIVGALLSRAVKENR